MAERSTLGEPMRTGEKIRRLRQRLALSQEDLAAQSGISADTIWRLETGASNPRPSTLRKAALALKVDVIELADDESASAVNGKAASRPR